jgi:hypothetical protein
MRTPLYTLLSFLLAVSMFAASPLAGTWKANIGKSSLEQETPREYTVTIQEQDYRFQIVGKAILHAGPITYVFTVPQTGGTFKYTEGAPTDGSVSTLSKRKADSRRFDFTITKNGKVIERNHVAVSEDSKSMRETNDGIDSQGKPFKNLIIFEKIGI